MDHDVIGVGESVRIWAIFRLYHPNFSGGAIQEHRIFERLTLQGFSVIVLAAGLKNATALRGQRTWRDGVEIRFLRVLQHSDWSSVAGASPYKKTILYFKSMLSALTYGILTAWTLWREGESGEIVRVYSANAFSFLPVWVARIKRMHPVLHMSLLNSDDLGFIRNHWDRLSAVLKEESFRRSELVTGYSTAQIQSCISAGLDRRKLERIPGGVDLSNFRPMGVEERGHLRDELGLRPDGYFIIFVGSAIERKGLDVLIEAFHQVRKSDTDADLLIVGPYTSGDPAFELADSYRSRLAGTSFASSVHWIGSVENVHDYMRVSDAFCLPTRREGFGIVIVEAMAVGLPVVVARLEGVTTDIVPSQREGILISGYDSRDYARALLSLHANRTMTKNIRRAARAYVISEFNLESVTQNYGQLYRKLASSGASN